MGHSSPRFPYMFWAHHDFARTRHPLSGSGMPTADGRLFAGLTGVDLSHPCAEALPALEAAIAARYGVDPARVLVTLGASGGMHLVAQGLFNPHVTVLADRPCYEPFQALPRLFGAELRVLERDLDQAWRLNPELARGLLGGVRGPVHVFLANPHNPTGNEATRAELTGLAQVAADHGGALIVCEVYMEYLPPAERLHAALLAPNAISISSLTKAYGLGSLRLGWIVLGEGLYHLARHLRDMAYLTYVDPPTVTLQAGRVAFRQLEELRAPVERNFREQRATFLRWLASTPDLECHLPAHGIIAFPRVRGVSQTQLLCQFLVEQHDVDVVPGDYFGRADCIRVGCGVPPEQLERGLSNLARGIAAYRRMHA